jgi:hypothetical protein
LGDEHLSVEIGSLTFFWRVLAKMKTPELYPAFQALSGM